ncbi:MAG: hypothetical protein V2I31_15200 [Mariniphaga sp.]|jgi:hypothetical protein|nr:hypothetical protein [Mariniphaga sp.]
MNSFKFTNKIFAGNFSGSLALVISAILLNASCTINNPVADISEPGYLAANIYWDVPVTNVNAGNEVAFYAEYWSVDAVFSYLGVWYDVNKNLKFTLTYPPTGYTFTLDSSALVRELLEIKTFQHTETNYDAEKKAYVIEDKFPVSYTLSSLEYKNPITFNQEQFNQLIPEYIRAQFVNNLFPQLVYQDFRTLLVTDRQIVENEVFEGYFDTEIIGEETIRTMKPEAESVLRSHLDDVPFSAFIYNKNRQYFAVEFTQGYQLNARFRIVNGNDVENLAEIKTITVL